MSMSITSNPNSSNSCGESIFKALDREIGNLEEMGNVDAANDLEKVKGMMLHMDPSGSVNVLL